MKKFILISVVLLVSVACEKENELVKIDYKVSEAFADTEVSYRVADGQMIAELIEFDSGEDTWTHTMHLERGEIVFLSASYLDSTSSVRLQVLMEGKVYKEASSKNEPQKYTIVSGTVPYRR